MDEYEKRAWEAEQQARRARTPEERKSFQEIAELWRRLGKGRDAPRTTDGEEDQGGP